MTMVKEKAKSFGDSLEDWSQEALNELAKNDQNGRVGQKLLSEDERVRVWSIHLAPGQRHAFHRHVLDYFWTALAPGRARSRYGDGSVKIFEYEAGETLHLKYARGESMIHDLTNIGETTLSFLTVEFRQSANDPLTI